MGKITNFSGRSALQMYFSADYVKKIEELIDKDMTMQEFIKMAINSYGSVLMCKKEFPGTIHFEELKASMGEAVKKLADAEARESASIQKNEALAQESKALIQKGEALTQENTALQATMRETMEKLSSAQARESALRQEVDALKEKLNAIKNIILDRYEQERKNQK